MKRRMTKPGSRRTNNHVDRCKRRKRIQTSKHKIGAQTRRVKHHTLLSPQRKRNMQRLQNACTSILRRRRRGREGIADTMPAARPRTISSVGISSAFYIADISGNCVAIPRSIDGTRHTSTRGTCIVPSDTCKPCIP